VIIVWLVVLVAGVALIVWGAEAFAENLGHAAARLGVGAFALALLLAGAEPEELATVVASSLRGAPGIGFGDIIGANVAVCLVALGVGAAITPLVFSRRVFLYALWGVPAGALSVAFAWDGDLSRLEGALLVALYVTYVAAIWRFERAPPSLGEVDELFEAREKVAAAPARMRVGSELGLVMLALVAIAGGSAMLVESVVQITNVESTQTELGLTLVGFATSFELVVLVWSAARRGAVDVALAGVVGSFAYNLTMSLGAGALVRPLRISDPAGLQWPAVFMMGCFVAVIALAMWRTALGRGVGVGLLAVYPMFVLAVAL
jgi:cation:H+ antiporter